MQQDTPTTLLGRARSRPRDGVTVRARRQFRATTAPSVEAGRDDRLVGVHRPDRHRLIREVVAALDAHEHLLAVEAEGVARHDERARLSRASSTSSDAVRSGIRLGARRPPR